MNLHFVKGGAIFTAMGERRVSGFFFGLLLTGGLTLPAEPQTLYAAASLTSALQELVRLERADWSLSFAGSGVLARQIEAGAPADLFISANERWMDYLKSIGRIETSTRAPLLANRLVIVAPKGEALAVDPQPDFRFADAFSGRIAIGDPDHVPAGAYAQQALQNLGWWETLRDRLAPAPHVRAALVYVERGECSAGIVYATDAAASEAVDVVAVLADSLHAPIRYSVAATKGARSPAVDRALAKLRSPKAEAVFSRHGFILLPQE